MGNLLVHPVSAHFSEEAMPDRLDAPLVARIVTVNDDVAAAQLDPVANLSIEAVHRRFLTGAAVPVIINCDASKAFASGAVTGASQVTNAVAKPQRRAHLGGFFFGLQRKSSGE